MDTCLSKCTRARIHSHICMYEHTNMHAGYMNTAETPLPTVFATVYLIPLVTRMLQPNGHVSNAHRHSRPPRSLALAPPAARTPSGALGVADEARVWRLPRADKHILCLFITAIMRGRAGLSVLLDHLIASSRCASKTRGHGRTLPLMQARARVHIHTRARMRYNYIVNSNK